MHRIQSVDTIRAVAITSVIAVHAAPFAELGSVYEYFWLAINQGARFAVPFFFVVSGYFFSTKLEPNNLMLSNSLRVGKRLLWIWVFWSLVYLFPYKDILSLFDYGPLGPAQMIYQNLVKIMAEPVQFLFVGSKVHLWFIMGLLWSVAITAVFYRLLKRPLIPLLVFSACLYIFAVCAKPYSVAGIGIDIDFNTRNGPFFGLIFFATGIFLSKFKIEPRHAIYGLGICVAGFAISFFEVFNLYSVYGVWPTQHDFVFGTLLVGLGVSMLALSNHPRLNLTPVANLGRYTLGIYAIHPIFIDISRAFVERNSGALWDVGLLVLVTGISVGVVMVASKFNRLRMFFV